MTQEPLPGMAESEPRQPSPSRPTQRGEARLVRPVRNQLEWIERDLDSTLAQDHPARAIWDVLERLDLRAFYARIQAVTDRPGHPATDPQVLLGLWVYATVEGVGSARHLDRLCREHDAYRWLRGGVPVNYHTLSDFRVQQLPAVDGQLTDIVGRLLYAGAVSLQQVAQDGMRVRASAGAASFRRKESLQGCLAEAKAQVERLKQEREHPDPGVSKRQRAARERAVRERVERVERALAALPEVEAAKARQHEQKSVEDRKKVTEPRASTTDPQARVMKLPDGGFRPAYNVELATAPAEGKAHGIIVGVAVTSEGTDAKQAAPMLAQVEQRSGQRPPVYLMDGGFASREAITTLERSGTTVYAPVRLPKSKAEAERYAPHEKDSAEVKQWRERMSTPEAQAVYRNRAALSEWANAQMRCLGMQQFTVRGATNALAVTLLFAVTQNLLRCLAAGFLLA